MAELLAALEATPLAEWARTARWGYALLNAAHIFGIALLVGAMVPLNLLRLGLKVGLPQDEASRVLVPSAIAGLCLAVATGAVMFISRAGEYAGLSLFQAKVALVAVGALTALVLALRHGLRMTGAPERAMRVHALASLILWVAVLVLGRLIAFV